MAKATVVKEILAATTSAAASTGFSVSVENPVAVFVPGLATTETADLQVTVDNGATFDDATDSNGTIQATASVNSFLVIGPGEYRINKSATASAVAVSIAG